MPWKTADGKVHFWTLEQLQSQSVQVFKETVDSADYKEYAQSKGWICLGALPSDVYDWISSTTYGDTAWNNLSFMDFVPADENAPCYWLTGLPGEPHAPVKLLKRSMLQLLLLRLDLNTQERWNGLGRESSSFSKHPLCRNGGLGA